MTLFSGLSFIIQGSVLYFGKCSGILWKRFAFWVCLLVFWEVFWYYGERFGLWQLLWYGGNCFGILAFWHCKSVWCALPFKLSIVRSHVLVIVWAAKRSCSLWSWSFIQLWFSPFDYQRGTGSSKHGQRQSLVKRYRNLYFSMVINACFKQLGPDSSYTFKTSRSRCSYYIY